MNRKIIKKIIKVLIAIGFALGFGFLAVVFAIWWFGPGICTSLDWEILPSGGHQAPPTPPPELNDFGEAPTPEPAPGPARTPSPTPEPPHVRTDDDFIVSVLQNSQTGGEVAVTFEVRNLENMQPARGTLNAFLAHSPTDPKALYASGKLDENGKAIIFFRFPDDWRPKEWEWADLFIKHGFEKDRPEEPRIYQFPLRFSY